jgi:hypothetical protein
MVGSQPSNRGGVLDGTIRQRDARASGVANQCSKGHAVGEVRLTSLSNAEITTRTEDNDFSEFEK